MNVAKSPEGFFKKPRCYIDKSDGCIDTWIEVMKLHFEEDDLPERQKCSALTSTLEKTALNCVMAKKQCQRDTAEKIFEILLNRFGSGVQGHQAMMRFEKWRQREDETIEKFLDDLEMLRRRSQPDESNRRMNLAVATKFIDGDGVKNDELRTMLATHHTPISTNAPTPEELRFKSKEYILLKPPSQSGYYKNNYGNFNNGPANQGNNWYKPRDDMDKRHSCANCSSTDHHVSACPTYKQGLKAKGFSLEDEDASEVYPSTEEWCIPADMEEGEYLMMDPDCEVNEKGTREKNDGNEVVEEGTRPPLDLCPNEVIEADDETLPYAEEDWKDREQMDVAKILEPDLTFTIQTRQNDRTRPKKKYNPQGDDFVVDRIDVKKIVEEVMGLEEITVSQDIDIVDNPDQEWIEVRSNPEVELDDEQPQSYEKELTNLRVLQWLN